MNADASFADDARATSVEDSAPSPDGAADRAGGNEVSAPDACAAYAAGLCARLERCAPRVLARSHASALDCRASTENACRLELAAPGVTATAAGRAACGGQMQAQDCRAWLDGEVPPGCAIEPGTREAGERCGISLQCRSLVCETGPGESCGACAALIGLGGDCSANPRGCGAGASCVLTGTIGALTGTCVAQKKLGESCATLMEPCAAPLSCVAGVCTRPAQRGDDCTQAICHPGAGLYCDRTTGTCVDFPAPAPVGAPCGPRADGAFVECVRGASCLGSPADRRCVRDGAEGEPCDPALGPRCAGGVACVQNVCRTPAACML
jgi:hypothetical protein